MSSAPPLWIVSVPGGAVDVDVIFDADTRSIAIHVAAFYLHLEPADVPALVTALERVAVRNEDAPSITLARATELQVSRGGDANYVWLCSGDAYFRLRASVAEGVADALWQLHKRIQQFGLAA